MVIPQRCDGQGTRYRCKDAVVFPAVVHGVNVWELRMREANLPGTPMSRLPFPPKKLEKLARLVRAWLPLVAMGTRRGKGV